MSKNIFGEELVPCSVAPMTGFYRRGCCETGEEDLALHTVCSMMTEEFLLFSKNSGNDLASPRPEFAFPGLKPGDRWCLCANRWMEAYQAGCAPPVFLEATNEASLGIIPMDLLVANALKPGK